MRLTHPDGGVVNCGRDDANMYISQGWKVQPKPKKETPSETAKTETKDEK